MDKLKELKYFKQIMLVFFLTLIVVYLQNIYDFLSIVFTILRPIIIGIAIGFILNIFVRYFEKSFLKNIKNKSFKRTLSIIISILIIVLFISLISVVIIPDVYKAIISFKTELPTMTKNINKYLYDLCSSLGISTSKNIIPTLDIKQAIKYIQTFNFDNLLAKTISATSTTISMIANIFIGFVIGIYFVAQKEFLKENYKLSINKFMKKEHAQKTTKFIKTVDQSFSNYFVGQTLDACILGLMCFMVMLFLKIPYATTIAVTIIITALIPIVGAWIGTFVGVLLILSVSPIKAIIFIIMFICLQFIDNNVAYPHVVGSAVGTPSIIIMIAITIGGGIAGFLGMILAVPTSSVLYTLYQEKVNE